MKTLPVIFVSHGAPTYALDPDKAGQQLTDLGTSLTGINAILVVSAHWVTQKISVSIESTPETIYDFGGFDSKLYELKYPAKGHPEIASKTAEILEKAGWGNVLKVPYGLDHGAWVPLLHLFPEAKIPVFQLSMPANLTTETALKLGADLQALSSQGVLIMASGSLTHNLYEIKRDNHQPEPYVENFVQWIRQAIQAGDQQQLVDTFSLAPEASRAHPTIEHFLPLLVAVGAAGSAPVKILDGGIKFGVLSMESYVFG